MLSCPAGKKFEILETSYHGTAVAAGLCVQDFDYDGVNALIVSETLAAAAGTIVARTEMNNHLLEAGCQWYTYVVNTTGGMIARITYVEVDT